jgi:hypothetical protein
MPESMFGVGNLFSTPTGANPTPVKFGRLQDVSVDFSQEIKPLYGSNAFPLENARGKGKIDLKATAGIVDAVLFNQVYFGLTTSAGETRSSIDEGPTPIPTTPFQITVTNGATFGADLGVYNTVTHLFMSRVASSPAAGQYSLNATTGVYTFAGADNVSAYSVRISYTYTVASATGQKSTFTNQLMGSTVIFSLQLVNKFTGGDGTTRFLYLNFRSVQASKLSMPMKLDDYTLPTFDMSVQDDGAGNLFDYSMTG